MISVIIPTLNSERALVPTLAALVPGAVRGVVREVIVCDGGSSDGTIEVADIAGCNIVTSAAPLASRLKDAAGMARAPWLLFLRPGSVFEPNWLDDAANFIGQAEINTAKSAAVFRRLTSAKADQPLREAIALLVFAIRGRPHPDQGLLIGARHYQAIGGHRAGVADPEAELLARLGRSTTLLRSGARRIQDG
jgi:glycosyltransferase involved in cell wall biosynthesis